ncbi:hypothetical protein N9H97_03655 [Gammaproteobacteria bacterium]|nr:hypothetical protein [Gammaproteobacteria bacterium]
MHNISQNKFNGIKDSINNLYSDFANKEKIVVLLKYWLFCVDGIRASYSDESINDFFQSDEKNPLRFSFQYEFNIERKLPKSQRIKIPLLFLQIFSFLLLPGSRIKNIWQKVLLRITLIFISSINEDHDPSLFKELEKLLRVYFQDIDEHDFQLLLKKLPKIFSSKQIILRNEYPLNIECAAACFFEYSEYEKIFLISRTVNITGLQHGGSYEAYKVNHLENYEKLLCNSFYGWGFSEKNIVQHRFNTLANHMYKRLIWLEDCSVPELYSIVLPMHNVLEENTNVSEFIGAEIHEFEYTSIPHPIASNNKYQKFRKDSYNLGITSPAEKIIGCNDIVIFDNLGSTVIFYCIYFQITFLLILDKDNLNLLHEDQVEWFSLLRNNGLAFFSNEHGKLREKISLIMDSNFKTPHKIQVFYDSKFLKK